MIDINRFVILPLTLICLFSSCTNNIISDPKIKISDKSSLNNFKTKIVGVAQFPKDNVNFQTKATLNEIAPFATVSVIYPPDHPTNANKTIVTGLTNVDGVFSINTDNNFSPTINSIYILEAIKRVGAGTRNITTIRTYIKWNGTSWQSMTFPTISINTKTTALAIIASHNTGTITADTTISKIDVSGANPIPQQVTPQITAQVINYVADLVSIALSNNYDPIRYIGFQNGSYIMENPTTI